MMIDKNKKQICSLSLCVLSYQSIYYKLLEHDWQARRVARLYIYIVHILWGFAWTFCKIEHRKLISVHLYFKTFSGAFLINKENKRKRCTRSILSFVEMNASTVKESTECANIQDRWYSFIRAHKGKILRQKPIFPLRFLRTPPYSIAFFSWPHSPCKVPQVRTWAPSKKELFLFRDYWCSWRALNHSQFNN